MAESWDTGEVRELKRLRSVGKIAIDADDPEQAETGVNGGGGIMIDKRRRQSVQLQRLASFRPVMILQRSMSIEAPRRTAMDLDFHYRVLLCDPTTQGWRRVPIPRSQP